ncbi:hypothetical protein GGR54DRAFT_602501 [Hypoxylon sp. NC1633]|nr:hypothetical protein GGR54DRAFT_602501 [Hypoxylon sp. NC1633]
MYFNRIRNIMRGSREFPGDDETDEPADEISPEDAQMYFNQIRRIMRGRAEQAGEDETGEPVDEISGEDAQMYLSQVRRIVRGAADIRESSSDRSLSPTVYSSTTQETNSDYDPEEGWRYEQVFLNQILNARNEYTLMPTTWRLHFRGIPLPEGLFYVKTQALSTRPRIYAHTDRLEYRGAVALRYLIQIGARVRDLRKAQAQYTEDVFERRIVKFITSKLRAALRWAELDGDIAKYSSHLLPNVRIMEMKDLDRLDMDLHIQDEMSELAASWRKILSAVPEPERPVAPVLFGFVIYKHILFIVTLDAQNPKARCHIPCQLNLSEHNQHQWNALAIMVTICWARDLFADVAKQIPGLDVQDAVLSDPDA